MAEPLDHRIVQCIAARLGEISVGNGYRTNAGEQVLTEENEGDVDDSKPVLEILDDDEEAEYQNCIRRKAALQFRVAVSYPAGSVTEALRTSARRVLADIRQALADNKTHPMPIGAIDLQIGGRTLFVREDGSRYFRPELRAQVTFHENHRSTS